MIIRFFKWTILLLSGAVVLSSIPLYGQSTEMERIGEKGVIGLTVETRAGDFLLKPGDYLIQHVLEGETHVIVFKRFRDVGGWGNWHADVVSARVECDVQPLGRVVEHMMHRRGTNAAGEAAIEEIHVAGESVTHLLRPSGKTRE